MLSSKVLDCMASKGLKAACWSYNCKKNFLTSSAALFCNNINIYYPHIGCVFQFSSIVIADIDEGQVTLHQDAKIPRLPAYATDLFKFRY